MSRYERKIDDSRPERLIAGRSAGPVTGVLALQRSAGNHAVGVLMRRLARRVPSSHPNAKALNTAQEVVTEGKVWTEQHYSDALLTGSTVSDRAGKLAYARALQNVEIELTVKQKGRQEFAPTLDDTTETRIEYRRDALWRIVNHKSVKAGLSAASAAAKDPAAKEQIRLVAGDMKLVQDEFRSKAYGNAYRMLDESSREIAAMLRSYGVMIAHADDVVRHVRTYEGDLEDEAAKWLETARVANTSGYSDAQRSRHRKDLGATLRYLRALQKNVRRQQREHPPEDLASVVLGPFAPKQPDHPDVKRAKAELAGAWVNAEREHPVLAGYRAGQDDQLEDVSLGSRTSGEKEDMLAVVGNATTLLANILTAKLALRQGKVSPFELAPVVALTRAQMLIRRGSVWDIAVEEMMRGDDEGEDWAKAAIQIALGALSLFPGTWVIALASVGLDLYSAGKAYVRYGLDKALVGTSLDRAKALSSKTPSLAGFAWALVGAGLNVAGARAAFGEAEALSARVLAGDAKAEKLLNELGESHGLAHLGEDVAKTRPAASQPTLIPPRSTHVPTGEEAVAGTGRRISPVDRGKGSRPFYAKDPKARRGNQQPGKPGKPQDATPTEPSAQPAKDAGKDAVPAAPKPAAPAPPQPAAAPRSLMQHARAAGVADEIDGPVEVFAYGTTREAATKTVDNSGFNTGGGNFGGRRFAATNVETARVFAARRVTQVEGSTPGIVGVALPKATFDRLKQQKLIRFEHMTDPPPELVNSPGQWIIEPGAVPSINDDGFFFVIE
jgi:hypothetical protein